MAFVRYIFTSEAEVANTISKWKIQVSEQHGGLCLTVNSLYSNAYLHTEKKAWKIKENVDSHSSTMKLISTYFHFLFLVSFYRNICFYIYWQRKCNFSVVLSGTETTLIISNGLMWTGRKSFLLRVLAATAMYPLPMQCLLPGTECLQPPNSSPPQTHFSAC